MVMLIIYIIHICEFSLSPKFIGHPQINILGVLGITHGCVQRGKKLGSLDTHTPS